MIPFQKLPVKRGSLSEMITYGNPCSLTTLSKNFYATSVAVEELNGMKQAILLNLSTIVSKVLHPLDSGNSVTKSI